MSQNCFLVIARLEVFDGAKCNKCALFKETILESAHWYFQIGRRETLNDVSIICDIEIVVNSFASAETAGNI